MAFNSRWVYPDRSVPFGKYWRSRPLVFSLVPRCQGLYGSAKKIWIASRWSQLLVLGHLFPPIVGQGFPQQGRHMPEFLRKALSGTRGIGPVHPGQDDQPCGPLHQVPTATITGTLDEVAFPVARHGAGGHLGGALGNRRHIGDLAPSIGPSCPRPTRLARLTQCRQQFAPQRAAGQHIQAHIDGLRRKLFTHVVRIRASETPGNLLGRAALGQLRPHVLPQPGIQEFARPSRLTGSAGRLACVPCRPDRVGRASRCGPTRGSRCWALAPTPSPSFATNGRGPDPNSRFHALRHSCVDRISFSWQHRSPSGREVLHLELELKPPKIAENLLTPLFLQPR